MQMPTNQPQPSTHTMNDEITPQNPQVIKEEQLEEVSGSLFDDNGCDALIKAPVHVLS
jgi:hypothetical protein